MQYIGVFLSYIYDSGIDFAAKDCLKCTFFFGLLVFRYSVFCFAIFFNVKPFPRSQWRRNFSSFSYPQIWTVARFNALGCNWARPSDHLSSFAVFLFSASLVLSNQMPFSELCTLKEKSHSARVSINWISAPLAKLEPSLRSLNFTMTFFKSSQKWAFWIV